MTIRTAVRLRAHAKVNLFLRVLGRRQDGFHEVETILHGVGLYDEMDVVTGAPGVRVEMRMTGGIPGTLPDPRENLVARAAALLAEASGDAPGADIAIAKGIPIGAGLGGGSADAAATLVTLAEMSDARLDRETLMDIALQLGSDVPYCIEGGTALATGRGEHLTPLSVGSPMWFVLAGPDFPLATRDVYEAWDEQDLPTGPSSVAVTLALGAGDAPEVATLLHNDLEAAATALEPRLADCKEAIRAAGALGAAMTGSGPTMFGITSGEEHAREVAARIAGDFRWVRAVSSQPTCIERLR
ncbi:MAG TPA: 4-(cytidine 5'-diphospho)-2-C-methyl-D-erythritol kinase [Actinomycetota bacterium]|nr:4-(cytidine 5'-diphospho)-2-C-methyl-D-erythritol kinase [Actinomycetota bacterium]